MTEQINLQPSNRYTLEEARREIIAQAIYDLIDMEVETNDRGYLIAAAAVGAQMKNHATLRSPLYNAIKHLNYCLKEDKNPTV